MASVEAHPTVIVNHRPDDARTEPAVRQVATTAVSTTAAATSRAAGSASTAARGRPSPMTRPASAANTCYPIRRAAEGRRPLRSTAAAGGTTGGRYASRQRGAAGRHRRHGTRGGDRRSGRFGAAVTAVGRGPATSPSRRVCESARVDAAALAPARAFSTGGGAGAGDVGRRPRGGPAEDAAAGGLGDPIRTPACSDVGKAAAVGRRSAVRLSSRAGRRAAGTEPGGRGSARAGSRRRWSIGQAAGTGCARWPG